MPDRSAPGSPPGHQPPEQQPPEGRVPVELLRNLSRQWSTVADRAFASGMTDPTTYARTVRLVAATVEALRTRGETAEQLLAAWHERAQIITDVADSDPLLTLEGLDPESVAGAAFAMRHREVAGLIAGAHRLATLATQETTAPWVALEESGHHAGDPFVPYRRLEVNVAAGRAILVSTRATEDFGACMHVVEELLFDRATGVLNPPEDGDAAHSDPAHLWEFTSAEIRERHVADLRTGTPRP